MNEPLVFLNGRFLPQSQASLSLHDAGFVMGATVTDLCRTFRHQLYRWPEHLDRFGRGSRATGIFPPVAEEVITDKAHELVEHNARLVNENQELALVLFATPGPIGYYLGEEGGPGDGPATFGMHTFPLPFARYRALVNGGAHLAVPNIRAVPGASVDPHIKQRSRMHWWLAALEAHKVAPGAIALLRDEKGFVTETAAANFLLVRNGILISPPAGAILEGISLGVVRQLALRLGIGFEEKPLTLDDCRNADEALLTSTPFCLAGVNRIHETPLHFPGPILSKLLHAWNEEVGLKIHEQILQE